MKFEYQAKVPEDTINVVLKSLPISSFATQKLKSLNFFMSLSVEK